MKKSSAEGDVFVEEGRLVFKEPAGGLSKDSGLGRAKKMLQIARAEAQTKMSFGGRVAQTGVDASGSMRNYYPSLKAARELAKDAQLYSAVSAFAEQVAVPSDLRPLLRGSLDLARALEAEPAGPLGMVAHPRQSLVTYAQQNQHAQLAISDAALKGLTSGWWQSLEQALTSNTSTPETAIAQARIFARVAELKLPAQTALQVGNWDVVAGMLPNTEEAARVFARLANANGVDSKSRLFHGRALSEWVAAGSVAAKAPKAPKPAQGAGTPIGSVVQANGSQFVQDARNSNLPSLAVSDASIPSLVGSVWQQFDQFLAENKPPETNLATLRFYARARELGYSQLSVHNWTLVAQRLPSTPEAKQVLRRAAMAFGAAVPSLGLGKRSLGSQPLGTNSYTSYSQIQQLIGAGDASVFKLDDASIQVLRQAYTDPYYFGTPVGWDNKDFVVGALALWARGATLGQINFSHLQHFVQSRIPAALVSDPEVIRAILDVVHQAGMAGQVGTWSMSDGKALSQSSVFVKEAQRRERLQRGASAQVETRRATERPNVKAGEPLGTRTEDHNALLSHRDPKFFELADSVLSSTLHGVGNPSSWLTHFSWDPRSIRVCARIVEITKGKNLSALAQAQQYLAAVPHTHVSDRAIPELVRLALAAGVELSQVNLQRPDGTYGPLSSTPACSRLFPTRKLTAAEQSAITKKLSTLDPSASATPAERRQALEELLTGDPKLEAAELLSHAVAGRLSGALSPVSMSGASEDAQLAFAKKLYEAFDHVALGPILMGSFAKIGRERVESVLIEQGYEAELAKTWALVGEQLAALDGKDLRYVLGPATKDQSALPGVPARLALAKSKLTLDELAELIKADGTDEPERFVSDLLERAALEPAGGKGRENVSTFIKDQVKSGALDAETVRQAIGPETLAILEPDLEAKLDHAVSKVIKAGPGAASEAIEALAATIKGSAELADPASLAGRALDQLYLSDLARVLPLDQADAELGGVGPALFEPKAPFPPGTETVNAAGVELAKNDRVGKERRAIPKKASSDLVMTETTQRNLKLMAAAWRLKRPVLLEGPTSSGKTSAVRYLAHLTDSPYRRINLSYYTDVSDLLGKYVGGEKRFDKAKLDAMLEEELTAHAAEYGIAEGTPRAKATEQILAAQTKARWVDGPVIRALKKGEVLLLDEMNLARPEVLERLNSLFDDDGNVVLTEHHNEVVKPDKNFRFFATMNPASYSGRARLSDAMKSRWTCVFAHGLTQADLTKVMTTKYGAQIPGDELAKLVAVHDNLSRLADEGELGQKGGGTAFTLRNLFRVSERFLRYRNGDLDDAALMRRETEELYAGGLFDPEDKESVRDILQTAMPYDGDGFYSKLELKDAPDSFSIGDVTIPKLGIDSPLVPGESSRLVMTQRTKEILYRLAKALDMGENVALIGERASGKTAIAKMFAMLREQPYQRQLLSGSTDAMQLVGGYDDQGWKDGLLLDAGRPDGTPGVFLGDELNLANPALLERLNSVLDDERKLVLAEKEGEEIKLHPEFRFVAAMNPPTKEYGGRAKLSKAMQNRFTMIAVPNLDDPVEQKEILKTLGKKLEVAEAVTDTLVDLQAWIRSSYEAESLGKEMRDRDRPVYSIRQLINATQMVGEFQKQMGPGQAYLLAVEATYGSSSELTDNVVIMKQAQELAK
ncbi:MAG: AAA family ATPase [Deltaproteobacteria bacterium]|nr:AAA family ATPase [Deltaproteobacteria bacterium]